MQRALRIAFLGDIYTASLGAAPDGDSRIRALLSECDHVAANLEGPITSRHAPIPKKGPVMKQTPVVLDLLRALHVDVVGLANNHILDHGEVGLTDTLQVLSQSGCLVGGAGFSVEQTYQPVRLWHGDLCVSMLFAAENGFGCLARPESQAGYAWLFHPRFQSMLSKEVRESHHVVVFVHAGAELIDRPLPEFRYAYKQLVDLGVSAVVGHHPHVTQGFEVYEGAPIFYSIGNLCFVKPGVSDERWYCSQIPILQFQPKGRVHFDLHHTRLRTSSGLEYDGRLSARERTESLSAEFHNGMYDQRLQEDILRLWRTRYVACYEDAVNAFTSIRSAKRLVRRVLSIVLRRRSMLDPVMILHNLEIESHRWAVARAMRMLYEEGHRQDA